MRNVWTTALPIFAPAYPILVAIVAFCAVNWYRAEAGCGLKYVTFPSALPTPDEIQRNRELVYGVLTTPFGIIVGIVLLLMFITVIHLVIGYTTAMDDIKKEQTPGKDNKTPPAGMGGHVYPGPGQPLMGPSIQPSESMSAYPPGFSPTPV
jgi:hypothetical protein